MNTKLEDAINRLPEHSRSCITNYIAHGQPPSAFVRAVLLTPRSWGMTMNFSDEAKALAGPEQDIELWHDVLAHAPMMCWGCPALVDAWIASGGTTGRKEKVA